MALLYSAARAPTRPRPGVAPLRGTTEGDLSYDLVRRRMELGWPLERLLDPPQRASKPAA